MKAAIYIRVSTYKEEQEASLIHQRQFFENYIKEQGWQAYDYYVDVETGTKRNRKALQKLIDDAKNRKFDIILSKELSRLARNQGLAHDIKYLVESNRIHLQTMDSAINTLAGNTHMFGLYAWIYEQEAQTTSNRIKMALTTRAKQGLFKGSNPPYGYVKKEGKLYISKDGTEDVVRRIFKRYLEGKGFDAIARELYNDEVITPSQVAGKKNQTVDWHGSTVRQILENPNYTGNLVQSRTSTLSVTNKKRKINTPDKYIIVENTHEAIISREEFETVQKLIESRRRKIVDDSERNSRAHDNVNLFTGILYCADCGHGFHFKKNRGGYICGRYNKHGSKACSDHHILEDSLISTIQYDLRKLSQNLNDEVYYNLVRDKLKKKKLKVEKELKTSNSKVERIKNLKNKALTKNLEGYLSDDDYKKYVDSLDEELKEFEAARLKLNDIAEISLDDEILYKVREVVHNALNFDNINREMINRFIEKIEVSGDKTIKIYYRFAGSNKVLNELIE